MAEAAQQNTESFQIPANLMGGNSPKDMAVPPTQAEMLSLRIPSRLSNLQKAAVLLITISQEDPKLVSDIYRKLNKKYLRFIIQEVSKLNFVDQNTTAEVISEFYQVFIEKTQLFGGKQVANDIIENIFGEDDGQRMFYDRKDRFKVFHAFKIRTKFIRMLQV